MAVLAYLRVSTDKQTVENQRNQINTLGFKIDSWYSDDSVSGTTEAVKRVAMKKLLEEATEGDTVVAVEVSRLGRSTVDVLNLIETFKRRGIKLRICNLDGIDLTSPTGRLMLTLMISCASFEKELLIERVNSGINRTRAQGTIFGASDKISPEALITIKQGNHSHKEYAAMFGVSTKTIQRAIKKDLTSYSEKYSMKSTQHLKNAQHVRNREKM